MTSCIFEAKSSPQNQSEKPTSNVWQLLRMLEIWKCLSTSVKTLFPPSKPFCAREDRPSVIVTLPRAWMCAFVPFCCLYMSNLVAIGRRRGRFLNARRIKGFLSFLFSMTKLPFICDNVVVHAMTPAEAYRLARCDT